MSREEDFEEEVEYLIDSDILIDFSNKLKEAADFLDRVISNSKISIISCMELLIGARNTRELESVEEFLSRFLRAGLSEEVGELSYKLLREYNKTAGLKIMDSIIAATAISNKLILVTRNARHFEKIKGLEIKVPY